MMAKLLRHWKGWLLLACYALALVLHLALGAASLFSQRALPQQTLTLADFTQLESIKLLDDGHDFVTTNLDAQMIYRPDAPFRAARLTFEASFDRPIVEMVLYYTTEADAPFSERQKLWAKQDAEGRWVFDLAGRSYTALRLDPDSIGGVLWDYTRVTLNAPRPTADYFLPDALRWLVLLFAPLLVWAALGEVLALIVPRFKQERQQ